MVKAYNETYLPTVSENVGTMLEHATDLGVNPTAFWNIFVSSNVAKEIERGNPKYLTCSAIDYLREIFDKSKVVQEKEDINKDEFYWAGWILTKFQYSSGYSFYKINNFLPLDEVLRLYPTLHEADESKFMKIAQAYFAKKGITNLKKIRECLGLSQSELAKLAEVDLRSIQMYEQRRNDINKAQAETLLKLSKVLGCNIEDLME